MEERIKVWYNITGKAVLQEVYHDYTINWAFGDYL